MLNLKQIDMSFVENPAADLPPIHEDVRNSFESVVNMFLKVSEHTEDCLRYFLYSTFNGEIVSYIFFAKEGEQIEIVKAFTAPEFQNKGFLKRNWEQLFHLEVTKHVSKFKIRFAEVNPARTATHDSVIRWYKKHGPLGKTLEISYAGEKPKRYFVEQ